MYLTTPVLMNLSLKLNICFHDDVEKFAGYNPSPKYQAGGGGGGKTNRPGQLAPHSLRINKLSETLMKLSQF